ncbi:MAG: hypothetical protein QME64_08485, partial [bacterium]|nr:hypothetical protein [bacterium]
PIAYLSTVSFQDPFAGYATWNGMPINYKLFNYKKLGGAVVYGGYWNWGDAMGSAATDHNAYCLESLGPDQKYSAAEWYDRNPNNDDIWRLYDPTNGTISNGDIIRLGGSSFHQATP